MCAVQEKYPGGRSNASASISTTPRGEDLGSSASIAASGQMLGFEVAELTAPRRLACPQDAQGISTR